MPTELSFAVRALQLLDNSSDGLRLFEIVGGLGKAGRAGSRQIVVLLRLMALDRRVTLTLLKGTRGGTYRITAVGRAWMAERLAALPIAVDENLVLTTGAMEREFPTIIRSQACPGQAHSNAPNSVFALGRATVEAEA